MYYRVFQLFTSNKLNSYCLVNIKGVVFFCKGLEEVVVLSVEKETDEHLV